MNVKKKLKKILTIKQLRDFLSNATVTRRFAESNNLVYFGSVGQDDESRLVKGITLSNTYRDMHYLVGTAYGRDLIFLQRSDTLYSATHKKREHYTWNILVVDLKDTQHLSSVYINGRGRHGHGFREMLAMKKREFSELPLNFLSHYDPLFANRFSVQLSAASTTEFLTHLNPDRAAVLAHHFNGFDFEWHDDTLYVYYLHPRPSLTQLEHMLKAGVWLAGELDKQTETPAAVT